MCVPVCGTPPPLEAPAARRPGQDRPPGRKPRSGGAKPGERPAGWPAGTPSLGLPRQPPPSPRMSKIFRSAGADRKEAIAPTGPGCPLGRPEPSYRPRRPARLVLARDDIGFCASRYGKRKDPSARESRWAPRSRSERLTSRSVCVEAEREKPKKKKVVGSGVACDQLST